MNTGSWKVVYLGKDGDFRTLREVESRAEAQALLDWHKQLDMLIRHELKCYITLDDELIDYPFN